VSDEAAATLGLVLDGGRARRMGGGDKGLVHLAGLPMIAHAITRLRPQVASLAISANGDPARFAAFGLPVLADDPADFAGPLAGVLAGLEYCTRLTHPPTHVASLPADTPFPPTDLVVRLHEARQGSSATIAVAASDGRVHHAVALWPVAIAPQLRRALTQDGVRKVERFAERFPVVVVEWLCEPLDPFFNVNAQQDVAKAEAALRAARGSGGGA
jgi:molybdopterin-guanine dinucleotide biosynthesis protein A